MNRFVKQNAMRSAGLEGTMLLTIALSISVFVLAMDAHAKSNGVDVVSGTVTNSKYLAITYHKYTSQKGSDIITGTIVNNSTKDIASVRVYAALYDDNDKLITTETGIVSGASLTPSLTAPFTINLVDIQKPDHYILLPGGTPS